MAKEKSAIERFAESKFMRKLQEGSQKLASNEIFSTISGGMGATMGLIMVGAVIQIVCAVGALFGWDTSSASYQAFYMPYKLTMGLMGFFMCFSMAYNYAKRKKMNQMQSVVTALVCYILVVSPPVSASVVAADGTIGSAFDALNLSSLGTGGMFVAIIVGLCSVAISKFVIDHLAEAIPLPYQCSFPLFNRPAVVGIQKILPILPRHQFLQYSPCHLVLIGLQMPLGLFLMLIFGFWFVTEVSCQIVYSDIDRVFHIEENIRKMKDAELEAALKEDYADDDTPEE